MPFRINETKSRLAAALALAIAGTQLNAAPLPHFPALSSDATSERDASARHALHVAQRAAWTPLSPSRGSTSNAHPRTFSVTSCADDDGVDTLRAVIAGAAEGDVVDLSALTCGTITLTQGVIDISALGPHPIDDLSIVGPGAAALTIDGNGDRVFAHGGRTAGTGTFSIADLTIANGDDDIGVASCIDSTGDVELMRAVVTGCKASGGSPVTFGGAISAASLYAALSTISNSYSMASDANVAIGGGAYVSGDASIVESTITGNATYADSAGDGTSYISAGGGLYVRGSLKVSHSTISSNRVLVPTFKYGWGGGAFVRSDVDVETTTITGNSATTGGGLYKSVVAVDGDPGTMLTMRNSTVASNFSVLGGGGFASLQPASVTNSTFTQNLALRGVGGIWMKNGANLVMQSSIAARNPGGDYLGVYCDLIARGGVTGANNVIIVSSEDTSLPADTLASDPMLSAVGNHGGPTETVAPYRGSPVIDAGANPLGLAEDQRGEGFMRVVGGEADIGAVELQENESESLFRDSFDPATGSNATCQFIDAEES